MIATHWRETPAGGLFLAELRRHWGGGNWRRPLLILAAILALQALVTVCWVSTVGFGYKHSPAGGAAYAAGQVIGALRLFSQPVSLLYRHPYAGSAAFLPQLAGLAMFAPGVAASFLLPAYAASSVGGLRVSGRLDDLIAQGCRPVAVFAAAGAAASLPFFVLGAVGLVLSAGLLLGAHLAGWASVPPPGFRVGAVTFPLAGANYDLQAVRVLLLWPVQWLIAAALFVGLSAVRRRPATAVADAYALSFLVFPGLQSLVFQVAFAMHLTTRFRWLDLLYYDVLALQAVLAALLWAIGAYRLRAPNRPFRLPKIHLIDPEMAKLSLRDETAED